MKSFFTTLTIIVAMVLPLTAIEAKAQTVTDINVEAYGNKVIVNYNLDKATDIDLYVSDDGGRTWEGPLKQVSGNIGKNVQPGSNSIIWDAIKERGGITGDDIRFDIRLPKMATSSTTYTRKDNDLGIVNIRKSTKTGDHYVIEYGLKEAAFAVCLYYSFDDGTTWRQAKNIEGDIYKVLPSDKRQMVWNYTQETGSSATPTFRLEAKERGTVDEDYRKDIKKKHFAAENSSAFYYDKGRLRRKYYEGWFVQPEIGVGGAETYHSFDHDYSSPGSRRFYVRSLTLNCLVGYQITRPFGIGLKIGYLNDLVLSDYHCQSMPVTVNMKGFFGDGPTSMYYNVGVGYLANLKGMQDYHPCGSSIEIEKSGLLLSAEIGLAIRNFNIGLEYGLTNNHYDYDNGYGKDPSQIVMLKFGYTIPFGEKR